MNHTNKRTNHQSRTRNNSLKLAQTSVSKRIKIWKHKNLKRIQIKTQIKIQIIRIQLQILKLMLNLENIVTYKCDF